MKTSTLLKVVCTGALAAACSFGLVACGESTASADDTVIDVADTSEGVAATVNGTEIGEKAITTYIANFRTTSALEDEATWAQWLVDNDYTVEDIRKEVIDYYTSQELIRQAAAENEVTVSTEEIDSQVETMRKYYSSDEEWNEALKTLGTTESQYRDLLEISLLQQGLKDKVATATEPTEEEMLEYAQMYASAYSGAKKSSHILFASGDEATAQEVLDKINAGELDFAEAAKEYSKDGSASDGGNVGWDVLTSFVTEYQDALDGLSKDQVSGLVTSDYGIHIIKCTDEFIAPEEVTSTDQLPTEFIDSIKSGLESNSKNTAYSEWYENYKSGADIVVNDMPEGLPYAVDLTGIEKTSTENEVTGYGVGESTEGTDSSTTDEASTEEATDASGESATEESSETADAAGETSEGQISTEQTDSSDASRS